MNITDFSAARITAAVRSGTVTATQVVRAFSDRIKATADLNNFITLCESDALKRAEQIDKSVNGGNASGKLLGVPIAIKDNIGTAGVRTTCASRLLENNVPEVDAEVVKRLTKAGAIVIGKTNMDEFAFGSTNEYSAYGAARNALDVDRVTGGSSGGSASAVAARQAPLALGTDTGGSVRQPAAFCGVVGLKPTFGAIDRRGVIGLCPSLEQVGIFARDADDVLSLFSVLAERAEQDLDGSVSGKTIGIAKEFLQISPSDGVLKQFNRAVDTLKALGVNVVDVSVPSFAAGLSAYHVLSSAEATKSFGEIASDFPQTEKLGAEVKRRLIIGAAVVDGDNYDGLYIKAARVRRAITDDYNNALKACDMLLCPTTATVAAKIGGVTDPQKNHLCDSYLAPVSLAGLPAVSVPFGKSENLPVGVQIIGGYNAERQILNLGKALMCADK